MNGPPWLRVLVLTVGIFLIAFASVIYTFLVTFQFVLFAATLIIYGLVSILQSAFGWKEESLWLRYFNFFINIVILSIGIVIGLFVAGIIPILPLEWIYWMTSIALILDGIEWVLVSFIIGLPGREQFKWLFLIFGFLIVISAALVFFMYTSALLLLVIAIALSGFNLVLYGILAATD